MMITLPDPTFDQHRPKVYAWAYRLLQNHHDALDVTQEVFLRWWRSRGSETDPANPVGWLRQVTVNLAIDTLRSARRRRAAPLPDEATADDPTDPALAETSARVTEALAGLTDRQRCIVVAKAYDGCTFAQIAVQLGTSVPTVKTHYLRGLRTLRDRLSRSPEPTRGEP
ncbi:MAG: RNA polymerase sigma factor [Planctomycetes bacterium]|nr:RNA polymerase sigma factor [Planctomycetota bacterium]